MKRPLTANEKAALRELKERLQRDFQLVEMRLFGSRAREEGTEESDLDVLVILERESWDTSMAIYDICFDLNLKHDVVLTCAIYSRERYASGFHRATGFHKEVERDGIRL
jgi:predicted nucleotidyltransferase